LLEAAIRLSRMDSGAVYLVDERTGELKLSFHQGFSQDIVNKYSKFAPDSASTRLVMRSHPLYLRREEFTPPFDGQFSAQDLSVLAMIPIRHEDKAIGCLAIMSRGLNEVPSSARDSLETIATEIGGTIDRIKVKEALERSEERYRFIVDNTSDVIWTLDSKLHYTYISPSVTGQRGYTVEESMSLDITKVLTPDSQHRVLQRLQAEMALGAPGKQVVQTNSQRNWKCIARTALSSGRGLQ